MFTADSYQFLSHSMFLWILATYAKIHCETIYIHTHTHMYILEMLLFKKIFIN